MTWSLKLEGGDLAKGKGNSLATTTGSDKVQQDLRHWILSNLGDDPLTPNFGSVIDFGEDVFVEFDFNNPIYVPEDRLDLIVEEVDRIIEGYQKAQYSRLQQEVIVYNGRHTFTSGEIIQNYEVEWEQVLDTLYIDIKLTMVNDEEKTVELSIKGGN